MKLNYTEHGVMCWESAVGQAAYSIFIVSTVVETISSATADWGLKNCINWPVIGPAGPEGFFMVGALSGFGSMSACAAGSLCAAWLCGADLPDYAGPLSLARYDNTKLITELQSTSNKGLL